MASSRARRSSVLLTALVGSVVIVILNLVHEAGHGLAGKAMGYDVIVRTNHAAVASGRFDSATDSLIMSAAARSSPSSSRSPPGSTPAEDQFWLREWFSPLWRRV